MLNLIDKWKETEKKGGKSMNLSVRIKLDEDNYKLIQGIQIIMDEKEWNLNKTCLRLWELGILDKYLYHTNLSFPKNSDKGG